MRRQLDSRSHAGAYALVLVVIAIATGSVALRIGYRDLTIGTDYPTYYGNYLRVYRTGSVTGLYEPGYEVLMLLGAALRLPPELFFASIAFFQMWLFLWAMRVVARSVFGGGVRADSVALVGSAILLVWPFYWSSVLNVVRQGLAIPLILVGLTWLEERRLARGFIALALASSLHVSSVVFGAVGLLNVLLGTRVLWLTVTSAVAYALQVPDRIVRAVELLTGLPVYTMVVEYGAGAAYRSGYRYDFLAFTIVPLVYWFVTRGRVPERARKREQLIAFYSTLVLPFLWIGFGNYMDRWLLPAWVAMPVVLAALTLGRVKLDPSVRPVLAAAALYVGVALATAMLFPESIFVVQGILG